MSTAGSIAKVLLQVGVPFVTQTLPKLLRGMADKLDPPLGPSEVAEVRRAADEARAERQAREQKP